MFDTLLGITNNGFALPALRFHQMESRDTQYEISSWFGMRVKKLRLEQNISQSQLGIITGLNRSSISRIEKGQIDASLKVVFLLAQALGTTTAHLVAAMFE